MAWSPALCIHRGQATGQITDEAGEIIFQTELTHLTSHSEACPTGPREHEASGDAKVVIPVTVNEGTITGASVPIEGEKHYGITILLFSN